MPAAVHAFLATSLDGFIAGPDDELDWLAGHGEGEAEDTFTPFLASIGAILMGRRTYDVVAGFDGPWPYGDIPLLVATTRPLGEARPTVRGGSGPIEALVAEARQLAGERDVYLDGGALFRAAFDADLVDTLTVTVAPVVLGGGRPLFAATPARYGPRRLRLLGSRAIGGGMVQSRYALRDV
jgi:dihydrofolate reductase